MKLLFEQEQIYICRCESMLKLKSTKMSPKLNFGALYLLQCAFGWVLHYFWQSYSDLTCLELIIQRHCQSRQHNYNDKNVITIPHMHIFEPFSYEYCSYIRLHVYMHIYTKTRIGLFDCEKNSYKMSYKLVIVLFLPCSYHRYGAH